MKNNSIKKGCVFVKNKRFYSVKKENNNQIADSFVHLRLNLNDAIVQLQEAIVPVLL